eukprot:7385963-Prymnesium_polylepis.2
MQLFSGLKVVMEPLRMKPSDNDRNPPLRLLSGFKQEINDLRSGFSAMRNKIAIENALFPDNNAWRSLFGFVTDCIQATNAAELLLVETLGCIYTLAIELGIVSGWDDNTKLSKDSNGMYDENSIFRTLELLANSATAGVSDWKNVKIKDDQETKQKEAAKLKRAKSYKGDHKPPENTENASTPAGEDEQKYQREQYESLTRRESTRLQNAVDALDKAMNNQPGEIYSNPVAASVLGVYTAMVEVNRATTPGDGESLRPSDVKKFQSWTAGAEQRLKDRKKKPQSPLRSPGRAPGPSTSSVGVRGARPPLERDRLSLCCRPLQRVCARAYTHASWKTSIVGRSRDTTSRL